MVTSLEASEKNVGNRESKSVRTTDFKNNNKLLFSKSVLLKNITVKEQRVDGSLSIKSYLMDLRCTLTGFERNYQSKNHSNLIIQRRLYHKGCKVFEDNNLTVKNKHIQLNEP